MTSQHHWTINLLSSHVRLQVIFYYHWMFCRRIVFAFWKRYHGHNHNLRFDLFVKDDGGYKFKTFKWIKDTHNSVTRRWACFQTRKQTYNSLAHHDFFTLIWIISVEIDNHVSHFIHQISTLTVGDLVTVLICFEKCIPPVFFQIIFQSLKEILIVILKFYTYHDISIWYYLRCDKRFRILWLFWLEFDFK